MVALVKEKPSDTARLNDSHRSVSSSLTPPPPDLESRLSTPESDDLPPPRLSMGHDPLAPTHTLRRTPPRDDDTLQSLEGARRMPLNRLSDRLSLGVDSDVDDTMMDIRANRLDPAFEDTSFGYGDDAPFDKYSPYYIV
jgi:hypothetical protein